MAEHQPAFGRSGPARTPNASEPRGLWHRPEWMNPLADMVLLAASIAIGYAAVKLALSLPIFSFREVLVVSPLSQVTTAQLEYAARSSLHGNNFFNLKLDDARAALEKLPWVRHAEVRRVWPATLEVVLEEHVAVAYWKSGDSGDMRLVNQFGEVFTAASNARMPVFAGPEGSAGEVLEHYKQFSEKVVPLKLQIAAVALSPREAWQLHLSDGLVVELGKEQAQEPLASRLSRFVSAWPEARSKLPGKPSVADLRYPSGFAVRVADATLPPSRGKQ